MSAERTLRVRVGANRQRLLHALQDIDRTKQNMVIGPSCYAALEEAQAQIRRALQFVLDEDEQDGVRHA